MKKIFYVLTAALLLTGALLTTGCTNDDTANDNNAAKTVTFTATLAPKGGASRDQSRACSSFGETQPALAEGKGGGEATRAITVNNKGTANETLTTAWKSGEKIAIRYQKSDDSWAKVQATVGTPNDDGSAPITATLVDAKNGAIATLIYPYSLANKDGDSYKWSSLKDQGGNLTKPVSGTDNISDKYDYAKGTATIAVNGMEATVTGPVVMENQLCICKFSFSGLSNDETENYYWITFDITEGTTTTTYTAQNVKKEDMLAVYMALLPVNNVEISITVQGYHRENAYDEGTKRHTYLRSVTGVTLEKSKFYRNVSVTLISGNKILTADTNEMKLQHGDILTGTGGENTILKIADGATVTLNCVTNTDITQDANIPGIECLGDATIILNGENHVRGREYAPGIFVHQGKTLTIMGSGTLNATGGNTSKTGSGIGLIGGAGIGGTKDVSCGNIVIAGGTVTATGTGWCAGIGSGYADDANITCGNITISGGTVTATGGQYGAGIGSGKADGANITCGDITISGGTVTATGGSEAAGIGSGNNNTATNTCGAITISGGMVTAQGGDSGAGIGSGNAHEASNTCGDISISGGTVTATGSSWAAGIGSGSGNYNQGNPYVSACGVISITDGTIEATGGDDAAGIGSGSYGSFASISIGSGITRVTATRSNNRSNVPIGKGFGDQGSGAVMFDGVTMHNGTGDCHQSNWTNWPETGGPFGGIQVSASDYGSENGRTWTLTPTH